MKRKTVIALCMLSIAATMGSYSSVMAEEKTSAEAAAESKEAIENELKDGITQLILIQTATCFM